MHLLLCALLIEWDKVHEAVISAGKTRSGCTVHQVTEEVDSGPIVVQEEVEVAPDDTPETLKAKVRETHECLQILGGMNDSCCLVCAFVVNDAICPCLSLISLILPGSSERRPCVPQGHEVIHEREGRKQRCQG